MKNLTTLLICLIVSSTSFAQAKEESNSDYKKVYEIIITKDGEVKHVVKEGADISVDINDKTINGKWFFESYPDKVFVVNSKGENIGVAELNKQKTLRIVTPQPKGGMRVGIGVGPVGVSSGGGSGMQSFNMEKYDLEISERLETKEEKIRREYNQKKEEERLAKQAAKQAKKDAKKKKK